MGWVFDAIDALPTRDVFGVALAVVVLLAAIDVAVARREET